MRVVDLWAYYRGAKDYEFNRALEKAARRRNYGSGSSRSMSDVSWGFASRRAAESAALRLVTVYRAFRKTGRIELVRYDYETDRDVHTVLRIGPRTVRVVHKRGPGPEARAAARRRRRTSKRRVSRR